MILVTNSKLLNSDYLRLDQNKWTIKKEKERDVL